MTHVCRHCGETETPSKKMYKVAGTFTTYMKANSSDDASHLVSNRMNQFVNEHELTLVTITTPEEEGHE